MPINIKSLLLILLLPMISGCLPENVHEITNISPTFDIESRPEFVLEVAPSESTIISLAEFEAKDDIPDVAVDDWENIEAYHSSICLKVETGLLAEEGDDFINDSTVRDRVTVAVDNLEVDNVAISSVLLQSIHIVNADGEYVKTGIEPKLICGRASLESGVHEVLFQFEQTSGNILEYEWSFILE